MTECTYCGCEVEAHDPVVVFESAPDAVDARDGSEFAFCNWGCLSAYSTESDVATGTTCNWTPEP
ncbi:hypothetical protein [Halorubellus litoreus]|uniref:YHS domain-containing protein n=1 Tax=Halorubellus litoreus TaxID=755308 RepID=A0ABD5V8J3_9EURY